MDPLSGVASIIAVIQISAKVTSLCAKYSQTVWHARDDISKLRNTAAGIQSVLQSFQDLLEQPENQPRLKFSSQVTTALNDCMSKLELVSERLEPGKKEKVMTRLGVRALKWPFTKAELSSIILDIERHSQVFSNVLQADQTQILLNIDRKTDTQIYSAELSKLPFVPEAAHDSHDEEYNALCLEETRMDLRKQIQDWALSSTSKCVFWLNGIPGTGKSTIARTMAQSFARQEILGASFFFKRDTANRSHAGQLFTTIASQLAVRIPATRKHIAEAIRRDSHIATKALDEQFRKLILKPLSSLLLSPGPSRIILVIDALDECEIENDAKIIVKLFALVKNVAPARLQIFITSRPELPIRLGFKELSATIYDDLILHQIPKATIEHDIELFLKHEFTMIRSEHGIEDKWPEGKMIVRLTHLAAPLFILAATVCRFVREPIAHPKKQLEYFLEHTSASSALGIDKTYLPVLDRLISGHDEKAKAVITEQVCHLVGAILFVATPLSRNTLAKLLQIDEADIEFRLRELHSVLDIPAEPHLPIRPFHLSFRDFLTNADRKTNSDFWVNEALTHGKLARRCLEFLSSSPLLKEDICDLKRPGIGMKELGESNVRQVLPAELQYACRYWIYHAKRSNHDSLVQTSQADVSAIQDTNRVLCNLLLLFLQQRFLFWLEALSLLGDAKQSIELVHELQFIPQVEVSSELSSFIQDARRFVLRNRTFIEDAPLQLYSSALLFAPHNSIVRKAFSNRIPPWIRLLPRTPQSWDSCLQTIEAHSMEVNAVAFSPDNQVLVSASYDQEIRLWDVASGNLRNTLNGDSGAVMAIAFSYNGQTLASGYEDGTVKLWDTNTGTHRTLRGHTSKVNTVAFSPRSQLLASGSWDKTIRLWNATTGALNHTLAYSHGITAIAFSPDEQTLASISSEKFVNLWDTQTRELRNTLKGHTSDILGISFSHQGLLASASHDQTVRIWDITRRTVLHCLDHSSAVLTVAFSPNGMRLMSATAKGTLSLWDVATGTFCTSFQAHFSEIDTVAFSPNGLIVASGGETSIVKLWDMTVETPSIADVEGLGGLKFLSNSNIIASVSSRDRINLWDITSGTLHGTLEGQFGKITCWKLSPDEQILASTYASGVNAIRLWDTRSKVLNKTLSGYSYGVNLLAFTPDGRIIASAHFDCSIRLWNVSTGALSNIFDCSFRLINTLVFSRDGKMLAFGFQGDTIALFNMATGVRQKTSQLYGNKLNESSAIEFSPDDKTVAGGTFSGQLKLWHAATGTLLSSLEGYSARVHVIAFSDDGQTMASSSSDLTIKLWDMKTHTLIDSIDVGEYISDLAFAEDGRSLQTNCGRLQSKQLVKESTEARFTMQMQLGLNGSWVVWKDEKLLWLPPEYRVSRPTVRGSRVILFNLLEDVSIMDIDTSYFE